MKKTVLAILLCILMLDIQASEKDNKVDPVYSYWWFLHNDGCYYLYRIETVEGNGVAIDWIYPLNYTNYDGTYVRCIYAETIETMC